MRTIHATSLTGNPARNARLKPCGHLGDSPHVGMRSTFLCPSERVLAPIGAMLPSLSFLVLISARFLRQSSGNAPTPSPPPLRLGRSFKRCGLSFPLFPCALAQAKSSPVVVAFSFVPKFPLFAVQSKRGHDTNSMSLDFRTCGGTQRRRMKAFGSVPFPPPGISEGRFHGLRNAPRVSCIGPLFFPPCL